MMTLREARRVFLERFRPEDLLSTETISSRSAAGRVLAGPVEARISSPGFHSAAMDGYGVRAADTFGASDQSPVTLRAGSDAWPVNTGHPMPENCDAVIMIEDVFEAEPGLLEIRKPVFPWQNVRKVGEDIVATELLFPTNHLLLSYDVAALETSGIRSVTVWERPRVTIIPTGSELVAPADLKDGKVPAGKTVESNSPMLASMAEQAGAKVEVTDIVPDDIDAIKQALLNAVSNGSHVTVILAGSSAGTADYTVSIIEELGELLVHGIAIMPGKPTALGVIDGMPIVGNPGYPVSSAISFEQFVLPLLAKLQHRSLAPRPTVTAFAGRNMPSRAGIREFRRMIVGNVGGRNIASPLRKGAGSITTLTRANAMLEIPENTEGIEEGKEISIDLLRPDEDISKTLLCVGSHDLALDIIKDFLQRANPAYFLYSTHVGSLGGLMAIRKGLAHLAGTHLLDPETGEYNTPYIRRYLPDTPVKLITLVHRQQGFIVPKGNPKGIQDVRDLTRDDVMFVNRQKGAGTRVLLDFYLEKAGISPGQVQGYGNEEYTHMAVAVDVLSGKADAGLGILAAARALDLDFVPLAEERYDLLFRQDSLEHPGIQSLLETIKSRTFCDRVEGMGGYSTRETGKVRN